MFVLYKNEDEIIVTTLDNEHECIQLYFIDGGRDREEYTRHLVKDKAIAFGHNSKVVCDSV